MTHQAIMSLPRRRPGLCRRAFTLIELLLVLVILASLAIIVVPKFTGVSERSKKQAAETGIEGITTALNRFEVECGRFPTTAEGLGALLEAPGNVKGWNGPYLEKRNMPKDPWGNLYIYRCPGQQNPNGFDLLSYGPDGAEGGGDDIDNWSEKK